MNTFVLASLIPLFLMGVAIMFIAPKISSKIGSLINWRRSFILAGIYLGILIISVPTLYLLPDKGLIKLAETSKEAVKLQSLLEGDLDKHLGLYKNSSQTFQMDTNKLTFNVVANMGSYRILVERKEVDDGKIEVCTYAETQMTMGIDVTKLVQPPTITLHKGLLVLGSSQQQRLEFKQFNLDFTAEYLQNQKRSEKAMFSDFGVKVIYIRVPKGIDIDKGNYDYGEQIQIINKKID